MSAPRYILEVSQANNVGRTWSCHSPTTKDYERPDGVTWPQVRAAWDAALRSAARIQSEALHGAALVYYVVEVPA